MSSISTPSSMDTRGDKAVRDPRVVVFVTPTPTHPPTGGNRRRVAQMIEDLRSLGLRVVIVFIELEFGDTAAMAAFAGKGQFYRVPFGRGGSSRWVRRVYAGISSRLPWLARKLKKTQVDVGVGTKNLGIDDWYDDRLDSVVDKVLAATKAETLWVNYAFMSRAFLRAPSGVRRVLDTHELFGLGQTLAVTERVWCRLGPEEEAVGLKRADVVVAIQEHDARLIRDALGVQVVTIGHRTPSPSMEGLRDPAADGVLYVASKHIFNVEGLEWFAREVYPMVADLIPSEKIRVVGDVGDVLKGKLPFHFVGRVEDLGKEYRSARIVMVPVQSGTGLKIKTVEAMAHGKAVIATPAGALGLEEGAGSCYCLAAGAHEFARYLRELWDERQRCEELGRNAVQFIEGYNRLQIQALERCLTLTPSENLSV